MYVAARAWGVQPSEFWQMTPAEWFAEYNFQTRDVRAKEDLAEEIRDDLELSDEEWWAKNGASQG